MKKQVSLQWRLTLLTALLVTLACLSLNFLVGSFAADRMDEIGDTVVQQLPMVAVEGEDSVPLTVYIEVSGQIRESKAGFRVESILITLAIVMGTSAVIFFAVGRALRPLRQLEEQTAAICANDLASPVQVQSSAKEIVGLTTAFNGMLARLNETFSVLRQFSANAAHELRTPLAVLQTRIDVLQKEKDPTVAEYAETLGAVRQQTDRLSHVIAVLLEMTELHTVPLRDKVALAELAEEVLCDLTDLAYTQDVTLHQHPGNAVVYGSDLLLYRAVYNLVENAIKYNRKGGSVTVSIRHDGAYTELWVTDTGIGIAEENFAGIFRPFFRVDRSRSRAMGGAGLGLALVSDIAIRHGGRAYVQNSSDKGSTIALRLPMAASEEELRHRPEGSAEPSET